MGIAQRPQEITSENRMMGNSYDQEFQTLVYQPLGYNGLGLSRMNADQLVIKLEYDGNGNPIYIGKAAPGTATSDNKWQIMKLVFNGSNNVTSITYASGSANFAYVWDDRASLNYS